MRALCCGIALVLLTAMASLAAPPEKRPNQLDVRDVGKSGKKTSKAKSAGRKSGKSRGSIPMFTAAREAAAMAFVGEHHPEIGKLLKQLKKRRPAQYHRAVRELFRTSERLAQWKEKDSSRYELELRAWKIKSRIQLLTARTVTSKGKKHVDQLRVALLEQVEVRLELMQWQRDRHVRRLEKLDADIKRIQSRREQLAEARLKQVLQRLEKPRGKKKVARKKDRGE